MAFRRLDPFGNPNVGVYIRVTGRHLLLPFGLTKKDRFKMEEAFQLEPVELAIGGSTLIGSLMAANRKGAVVSDITTDEEIDQLQALGLKTYRLEHSQQNAAGNNILCNDSAALVNFDVPEESLDPIANTLGVPVRRAEIAGVSTLGTAAVATARGVLAHPLATEADLQLLEDVFGVQARIGTVNHGQPLVGAGLAANEFGVVAGTQTTGIELGRIEDALGFLDEPTQSKETSA